MIAEMIDHLQDFQPPPIERTVVDCEACGGSGWREYQIDVLGFAEPQWGRCNAVGCVGGEIETEVAA